MKSLFKKNKFSFGPFRECGGLREARAEVNHKIINQLETGMRSNGSVWLENQKATLLNIASQCPYKGGEAVYRARLLLKAIHDTTAFEDESVCLSQGIYRDAEVSLNYLNDTGVKLIPNPASDYFQLQWYDAQISVKSISIYDSRMQKCIALNTNQGIAQLNINIDMLPPGVYTVALQRGNYSVIYKKLIVIR